MKTRGIWITSCLAVLIRLFGRFDTIVKVFANGGYLTSTNAGNGCKLIDFDLFQAIRLKYCEARWNYRKRRGENLR